MRVDSELLDVFDRCIADVRAGRKTIESCLEEHPSHRADLAAVLAAATAIVPSRVDPGPARRLQARYLFVEALHHEAEGRRHNIFGVLVGLRRQVAGVAIAAILAVAGSGAAVVAAQDAQPNDPLYGLKTAVEQQQVALAASAEERAQLRVQNAQRRLAEVERAIAAGREDAAIVAATAYGETMERAYEDIENAQGAGRVADQAQEAANDSLARLQGVAARASSAGSRSTAAALASAAERADRDRARRQSPTQVVPTGQASAPIVEDRSIVSVAPTDEPTAGAEPTAALGVVEPTVAAPPTAAVPASARVVPPAPAGLNQGRGNADNQGNAAQEQRGGPGRGNDREDDRDEDRGRGPGQANQDDGGRSGPPPQPTRAAQSGPPTRTPTVTPRGSAAVPPSGRDGGRDDERRSGPSTQATATPRGGASGDDRTRPPATATTRSGSGNERAIATPTVIPTMTPTRSGSSGSGSAGDDDDDSERDNDRDRDGNRGANRD